MELHYYKPTDVELWITSKYQENGIRSASDLDIDLIADIFGIDLHISSMKSFTKWEEDQYSYIIISDDLATEERREHFFHELCHPLRHVGQQNAMCKAFKDLQEIQAAHFQLYAAMPAYMLDDFKDVTPSSLVKVLAEEFRLREHFVRSRLEQIKRRIQIGRQDADMTARMQKSAKIDTAHVRRVMEEFGRRKRERQAAY